MSLKDYDPAFARKRVQLTKKGFSHDEITSIFETISSPDDLTNFKLIAQKCEELVLMPQYREYLGLIDEICKFLIANENQEICKITATKKRGRWLFTVGAH